MLVLGKDELGPWAARRINMTWTPENSECIGWEVDGEIRGVVWYEDYNPMSIMAHIAIDGRVGKDFYYAIFDYPFNQLGVKRVICPIIEGLEDSKRLCLKLGFTEYARFEDSHIDGDMVFYSLKKEDCKYLGERYGKRR